MSKFYDFLPEEVTSQFEHRYKTMRHRYKDDERTLNIQGLHHLMRKANEYLFSEFPYKNFHKSYAKYKNDNIFSYLEQWENYTVLLIWFTSNFETYYLQRVLFINNENSEQYTYAVDSFREIKLMRNAADVSYGSYYTDGETMFYHYHQRKLDPGTYDYLKSQSKYKYLPIEKFQKVNLFLLLTATQEMINNYEFLLKFGAVKCATELLLSRSTLDKEVFIKYKSDLKKNRTFTYISNKVNIDKRELEKLTRKKRLKHLDSELKKMKKLFIEYGKYIFMNPTSFKEMQYESNILNHCLGKSMIENYTKRIIDGTSKILFLREKENPDRPFFTIEIQGEKLVQCRTTSNGVDENITQLVNDFISQNNQLIIN